MWYLLRMEIGMNSQQQNELIYDIFYEVHCKYNLKHILKTLSDSILKPILFHVL